MTIQVKDATGTTQTVNTPDEVKAAIVTAITGLLSGVQPVSATALPLPAGAATQTTLAAVLTALGTPAQAGVLPTGAATATAQTTLQTSIDRTTPADTIVTVTPSDTVDLATVPKALYVTASGTLSIKDSAGTTISLGTPAANQLIPIRARRVMATGTTATVLALS